MSQLSAPVSKPLGAPGFGRRLVQSREISVLVVLILLCFLMAYPDNPTVRARARRLLRAFHGRSDLRRHRNVLADTGIAGTDIRFRFFAPTAIWMARRWPGRLQVDWKRLSRPQRLESVLPLLVHYAETPGLDELVVA